MTVATYIGVGGTYKTVAGVWIGVGGTYKTVVEIWQGVSGVWKPVFAAFSPHTDTFNSSGSVVVPLGAAQLVITGDGLGATGGTGTSGARAASGAGSGAHGTKTIAIAPGDWGTTINFTLDATSARTTLALTNFSGTLTAGSGQNGTSGSHPVTGGAAGVASGSWGSSTNGSQGGTSVSSTVGGSGANSPGGATGGAGGLAAGNVAGGTGGTPGAGGGGGPYDVTDALNGIPGGPGAGQWSFAWT